MTERSSLLSAVILIVTVKRVSSENEVRLNIPQKEHVFTDTEADT